MLPLVSFVAATQLWHIGQQIPRCYVADPFPLGCGPIPVPQQGTDYIIEQGTDYITISLVDMQHKFSETFFNT